jgi:2-oxoisovalerate dehydrogenase E1 component
MVLDAATSASTLNKSDLIQAFTIMVTARAMANLYEENKAICAKYVHATSRGHEAIQIAAGLQLTADDFASPYYRDDSMLLAMGLSPYELMLQLLAKRDDPFSGGRTYYCHPSLKREGFPTIPHQSSATGMQAIPATGMAHGIKYLESQNLVGDKQSVVLCSLGDGSVTEGEIAEAFQMAVLKSLPIIFLVQDNGWSISAHKEEFRKADAFQYAAGFPGLERRTIDGTNYVQCLEVMQEAFSICRTQRSPVLVHAKCPLIGHHTSGVRREWYRQDDLEQAISEDPVEKMYHFLLSNGTNQLELDAIIEKAEYEVFSQYEQALAADNPDPTTALDHEFAPTYVGIEKGTRTPTGGTKVVMVDAALHAVEEILQDYPNALFYGQDVGGKLGGVFREAAMLAVRFGDERVFNTPIQEAYIIGSTVGMSAVGAKPIVEVQFADYIWPGMNQLAVEMAKSCYLTNGKFPVGALVRIPIGAYGGGGPYHSGSIESTLLNIRGIKVCYPSNAADMKGLMKAAFLDPNPVIMLEHKGLYWSKVQGTDDAKTIEPDRDYILPLGKGNIVQYATEEALEEGNSCVVITYGMGVYWAKAASEQFKGSIEIVDLRTLNPLDEKLIMERVKIHGKAIVVTEEPLLNSFAESLACRITQQCFRNLDAPVATLGSAPIPAIPLNQGLEAQVMPSVAKLSAALEQLLNS